MKKYLAILIICFISITGHAQTKEPGNNLGKTLYEMRSLFPEIRYIKTDEKGAMYQDGYTQDGISFFWYFRNDIVIEESLIIQSDNGFPRDMYNTTVDKFIKTPYRFSINKPDSKHYAYSTFTIHLYYTTHNNKNTFVMIWKTGGYDTSVSAEDFYRMYK